MSYISIERDYWLSKLLPNWQVLSDSDKDSDFFQENIENTIADILAYCHEANKYLQKLEQPQSFTQRTFDNLLNNRYVEKLNLQEFFPISIAPSPQQLLTKKNEYLEFIDTLVKTFQTNNSVELECLKNYIKYKQAFTDCNSHEALEYFKKNLIGDFLEKVFPEFENLNSDYKEELLNKVEAEYQTLLSDFLDLQLENLRLKKEIIAGARIAKNEQKIAELQKKLRTTIFHDLQDNIELKNLLTICFETVINQEFLSLEKNYPNLKNTFRLIDVDLLLEKYLIDISLFSSSIIDYVDNQLFSTVAFSCFENVTKNYFGNIDSQKNDFFKRLNQFNLEQSAFFTKQNFTDNLVSEEYLKQYSEKLNNFLIDEILDGALPEVKVTFTERIKETLSELFKNKEFEAAFKYLKDIAIVHAFIQHTGWSTQNESSHLAALDCINYFRFNGILNEIRHILTKLASPILLPLYYEYKSIAHSDDFILWKLIRFIIPMLIIVGFLILIAVMLSSLALPELIIAAVMIPTFFVGISFSAFYVQIKNNLAYQFELFCANGAIYEVSGYQINKQLIDTFNSPEQAEKIRKFYVGSFINCDKIEDKLEKQLRNIDKSIAKLTKGKKQNSEEYRRLEKERNYFIEVRLANCHKKNELLFEWFDLTINPVNKIDAIAIAHKRIKTEHVHEHAKTCEDMIKVAEEVTEQFAASFQKSSRIPTDYSKAGFFAKVNKGIERHNSYVELEEIFRTGLNVVL